MIDLAVAADDRTGALETAAACADAGWSSVVVPLGVDAPDAACVVTDLGSRHVTPHEAARRATAAGSSGARRHAHKIDSTLRGNWAVELAARSGRVAVVAGFPAAGRTCVGGVVLDDRRPVAEGPAGRDRRGPVRSSAPAEHLRAAGVREVELAPDAAALARWVASGQGGAVVVDLTSDADLAATACVLGGAPDVLLAGTSAAIAAFAAELRAAPTPVRAVHRPVLARPTLVVCGSRHPMALEQLRRLRECPSVALVPGRPPSLNADVLVVAPDDEAAEPERVAAQLGATVAAVRRHVAVAALVIVGGDTAAAVLGDAPVRVLGTAGIGVARCRLAHDATLDVLVRPGGFGDADALVTLLGLAP